MNILTELRTALEMKQASDRGTQPWHDARFRLMDLLLNNDDTIRALFDVAEAMDAENNSSGEAARQAYVRGRAALAPLVKERGL